LGFFPPPNAPKQGPKKKKKNLAPDPLNVATSEPVIFPSPVQRGPAHGGLFPDYTGPEQGTGEKKVKSRGAPKGGFVSYPPPNTKKTWVGDTRKRKKKKKTHRKKQKKKKPVGKNRKRVKKTMPPRQTPKDFPKKPNPKTQSEAKQKQTGGQKKDWGVWGNMFFSPIEGGVEKKHRPNGKKKISKRKGGATEKKGGGAKKKQKSQTKNNPLSPSPPPTLCKKGQIRETPTPPPKAGGVFKLE